MKKYLSQGSASKPSDSIHPKLKMYALAASAAGVGMLALGQPVQAEVVFTKAHQVIGQNGVYNLDLNNDGTVDFLIQEWDNGAYASSNALLADEAVGNAVEGEKAGLHDFAGALMEGAPIGPNQKFVAGGTNGEVMASITHFTTGGTSYIHGVWANVRNRYLGLKFEIHGETHYGWARLSVQLQQFHITATLTGYGYETVPNKALLAGQASGNIAESSQASEPPNADESVAKAPAALTFQPGSLASLALGSQTDLAGVRP